MIHTKRKNNNNETTGSAPSVWEFLDEMEEVVGDRRDITMTVLLTQSSFRDERAS